MNLPFKTEKPVLEWRKIGNRYLVIYDYMDFPKGAPARNLFAYAPNGDFVWQAEAFSTMDTDASVNILCENPLVVGNFTGYEITYDIESGKVIDTKLTR